MYIECMNVESNVFSCWNERTDKQFRAEHMKPPFLRRVLCMYSSVDDCPMFVSVQNVKMYYGFPAPFIYLVEPHRLL